MLLLIPISLQTKPLHEVILQRQFINTRDKGCLAECQPSLHHWHLSVAVALQSSKHEAQIGMVIVLSLQCLTMQN